MKLEVIERHVFHVTDPDVANHLRQALRADDIERLDELVTFLQDGDVPTTCDVLDVAEVTR